MLLFTFCSLPESKGEVKFPENFPDSAIVFLKKYFKDIPVIRCDYIAKDTVYKVYLKNAVEVRFAMNGEWRKVDGELNPLPEKIIKLIPVAIPRYAAKVYPRRGILSITRNRDGYRLELTNRIIMYFNKDGSYERSLKANQTDRDME